MRRKAADDLELDDDRMRIDVAAVHAFLSTESYWAAGRTRAEVERHVDEAARVVGLYDDSKQIGFSRTTFAGGVAFLWDVYVLPGYRGRGLGVELVRETVDRGPYAEAMWLPRTADAHELYGKFGFDEPDERWLVRMRRPG